MKKLKMQQSTKYIAHQSEDEDEIFGKVTLNAQKAKARRVLYDFKQYSEIKRNHKTLEDKINNAMSITEINHVLKEMRSLIA